MSRKTRQYIIKTLLTPRKSGHVRVNLSNFKQILKIVTVSVMNIGGKAAKVTNYSNNYILYICIII